MKTSQLHPELRLAFRFIPTIPFHHARVRQLANWLLARQRPRASVGDVAVADHTLAQSAVRVYRGPGAPSGAGLLWVHGGGMITGAVAMDDALCARFARELQLVVVSVNYRLAPRHPFPAALDDCYDAWRWFQSQAASLGVDPHRIALAGQSAGGGLAATLAQRIHDAGGVQPAGVSLLCPMLDDRPAARRELDRLNHRVWNNKNNRAGWSAYLRQPPGSAEVPAYAVASRRSDLRGLPPTWLAVGDIDLLYAEGRSYHERLVAAGVDAQLYVVPQAPHGFEAFLPKSRLAREMFRANEAFLRARLGLQSKPASE